MSADKLDDPTESVLIGWIGSSRFRGLRQVWSHSWLLSLQFFWHFLSALLTALVYICCFSVQQFCFSQIMTKTSQCNKYVRKLAKSCKPPIQFLYQWIWMGVRKIKEAHEGVQMSLNKAPNWSCVLFMWPWQCMCCHEAVISATWEPQTNSST